MRITTTVVEGTPEEIAEYERAHGLQVLPATSTAPSTAIAPKDSVDTVDPVDFIHRYFTDDGIQFTLKYLAAAASLGVSLKVTNTTHGTRYLRGMVHMKGFSGAVLYISKGRVEFRLDTSDIVKRTGERSQPRSLSPSNKNPFRVVLLDPTPADVDEAVRLTRLAIDKATR